MTDIALENALIAAGISVYGANCMRLQYKPLQAEILRFPESYETFLKEPLLYGMPPLFPPNRIRGGAFQYQGMAYQFPINESSAGCHVHGNLYAQPFEKTVVQQDRAILRHAYREGEYIGFPHAFTFEIEYVLKENGIRQNVRIKNDSPRIMPCMLAFHTTFCIPFSYSPRADAVSVKVPIEKEFVRDQNFLPTGQIKTDTAVMRLLNGEGFISEKQYLSAFYSSAGNTAVLFDKQIGLRVEYQAVSEQYKYWMLWNGGRKDLFCIEPQTCMIDAFHHQEDGQAPGVFGIPPGKTAELCTELVCFAL